MSVPTATRFIRRTSFQPDEQHVNFTKLDNDILDVITSPAACEICPSIARVYLRLLRAPFRYWEREGVLYFNGEESDLGYRTAWQQLTSITGVGNTTLSKALRFLHDTGVIGYSAKAAGAGIRIFFNHAQASIKKRAQKNLRLVTTPVKCSSNPETRATFSGVFLQEVQDINSRTSVRTQSPSATRTKIESADEMDRRGFISSVCISPTSPLQSAAFPASQTPQSQVLPELRVGEPLQVLQDWLNHKAIPKATRIAVKESLNWLKAQGLISKHSKHIQKEGNPDSNSVASSKESYSLLIEHQAEELLQTLSPQQKQRWGDLLKEEITRHTRSNQLGYWDEQTWLETIRATMQLRLKTALSTVNYCSQRASAQLLNPEELDELSQAYALFAELFEKDVGEVISRDLEAGKLPPTEAQKLIDYCRSRKTVLTIARDQ
jgi:hypothetical protein